MSTIIVILGIILLISSVIQLVCVIYESKHVDGTLVVDQAADSYTIHITTDPVEINSKDSIRLRVETINNTTKY